MEKDINTNSIGGLVYRFLLNQESNNFNKYYPLILEAVEKLLAKVIEFRGLKQVISEQQKENSVNQLIIEIFTKPADFEKDPSLVTSASKTSSKIRYLVETSKEPEHTISSYLSKRAFTLLKFFAEGSSKEYLANCQNLKQSIRTNLTKNKIHRFASGAISYDEQAKICFIKGTHKLNFSATDGKKLSAAEFILTILEQNRQYYFRINDLVYYLARNQLSPNIVSISDKDIIEVIDTNADNKPERTESKNIALDALNELIKYHFSSKSEVLSQLELAMIAYLCKATPGYFSPDILTENQKNLPTIDAIENFLNDKRFLHLFRNERTIQRTTAFKRLDKAKKILQNVMCDLSALEQMEFIKEYCKYLESRYNEMVGEKHE